MAVLRRSRHGPQSGGFYVCTLQPEAPVESPWKTLTQSVGLVLRSTLKLVYTRQAHYIRRYFAQSDDIGELHRLVTHMNGLLTEAMPGEDSAEPAAVETCASCGAVTPQPLPCSSMQSSTELGGGSPPAARARHGSAHFGSANMLGVPGANGSQAHSRNSSATSLADRPHSGAASVQHSSHTVAHTSARATWDRSGLRPRGATAAALAAAERAASVPPPMPVSPPAAAGDVSFVRRRRNQRISADSSMGSILEEWERAVETGRNVLRNTYIATYYMERCAEREYLESLQQRLELQIAQLTEMLRGLPHRRSVLDSTNADVHRPGHPADPIAAVVHLVTAALTEVGRGAMSVVEAMLMSRSNALREISVQGQQVRSGAFVADLAFGKRFTVHAALC